MSEFETPHATWRKSSLCNGGGCVEVAVVVDTSTDNTEGGDEVFLMRSSRDPGGQTLRFASEEWAEFIAHIKEGAVL
jgi:hypothetical protein